VSQGWFEDQVTDNRAAGIMEPQATMCGSRLSRGERFGGGRFCDSSSSRKRLRPVASHAGHFFQHVTQREVRQGQPQRFQNACQNGPAKNAGDASRNASPITSMKTRTTTDSTAVA
jgi:hypothetical protein